MSKNDDDVWKVPFLFLGLCFSGGLIETCQKMTMRFGKFFFCFGLCFSGGLREVCQKITFEFWKVPFL